MGLWVAVCIATVMGGFGRWSGVGAVDLEDFYLESVYNKSFASSAAAKSSQLYVPLTLIENAHATGAVCLDGSLPAYHLHKGYGSGGTKWLIHLEGGGWCNNIRSCKFSRQTHRGSSKFMEKWLQFTGILSNRQEENPDFYNWNRVIVRYCDGASFTGDSESEVNGLHFRGQRIWKAAIDELMSRGMRSASHTLLSGCSAGGLATILHCDEFQKFFGRGTTVKCLSDAGLFMNAMDVSHGRTLQKFFQGVVKVQGSYKNLPSSCTGHRDPALCFFPQYVISDLKTPLFILNAAYDSWQIQASLAPSSADPNRKWYDCKLNYKQCSGSQIEFFQGFRNQTLRATRRFARLRKNGLFINSCFAHCQSERQDTWLAPNSPVIGKKTIALAVGDWYFERAVVAKYTDCAYPCGSRTCHNLVFK
ncbi:unnamed protein product [Cuscuta epithymum]|uniref:Pectin acetylesterase n=1 Tax=Cuscuta epithymum TaxID=186058 RepID=A0AAV0FEE2_9ASTE|nr:unnamed protein product [Cuscuta epithymum]